MKKLGFLIVSLMMIFAGCAGMGQSVSPANTSGGSAGMDLDAAIKAAAAQMEANLPGQTKVALVSIASTSAQLSEYVISRLEASLVGGKKLVVVDRANLDRIRDEQGFQLSGEVSDESAKAIGKLLGAGAIVTGSFTDLGDVHSLTVKAINMETAAVAASYPADIAKSKRIETLLASGGGTAGTQTAQRASTGGNTAQTGSSSGSTTAAAPVGVVKDSYSIGERGPAGGWIFYDKGDNGGGWRYLEAAPASSEFKALWSANGSGVDGTETGIGTGKKNTRIIMEAALRAGQDMPAARQCARLKYGGYEDWFLPSKAELGLMYLNLKTEDIGGFSGDEYLSSSEAIQLAWSRGNIWVQKFSNGTQFETHDVSRGIEKNVSRSVRAIRQF